VYQGWLKAEAFAANCIYGQAVGNGILKRVARVIQDNRCDTPWRTQGM